MTSIKRGTVAALAGLLAASAFILPPEKAEAQTLMDLLFGNRRAQPQRVIENRETFLSPDAAGLQEAQRTEPQPVVAGPRYYTYKPEALAAIDFTALADPVVTGSVDAAADAPVADASFAAATRHLAAVSVEALPEVGEAVTAHYSANPDYVWVSKGKVNAEARRVMALLEDAASVGLSSADYRVALPEAMEDPVARERDLIRFEMELSARALTYALDATRGRIDPNKISGYHDFKRKTLDLPAVLTVLSRSLDPAGYLATHNPSHAKFRALAAELERLRDAGESDAITIAEGTLLKPGTLSPEVKNVVAAIREKASDAVKTDHALTFANYKGEDVYSPEIVALVKAFQSENGLAADGIVGRATVRELVGMTHAAKIDKLRFALEQARWLNRDLGERHVFINQPAFRVTYTEDGAEKLAMRAVVGTKANQTYFFQDKIETVEFNPYWGVPRSIIVNEMLPKLRADPSYLDRLGYEVTTQSGTRVASSSVNWYGVGSNPGFNVRQPPGSSNALGELKILFPNAHAIYMHDTPAKDLFARDTRAYSHGCVRLEDPRAMAAAVLGTTKADVGTQIADGRNKAVTVGGDIPVYVAYFTAWPNGAGEVEYFDDIYERDMYLKRAMDATDAARQAQS